MVVFLFCSGAVVSCDWKALEIDFDFYKLNCTLPELRKVTIKDFDAETDSEDYIIGKLNGSMLSFSQMQK